MSTNYTLDPETLCVRGPIPPCSLSMGLDSEIIKLPIANK